MASLPPEDFKKIAAFLAERWGDPGCPICKRNDYNVGAYAHLMISADPMKNSLAGEGVPLAVISCKHCGHVMLLDLFHAGIFPGDGGRDG